MREILFRGQTRRKGEKVKFDGTPVESNWVYGGLFPSKSDFSVIYQQDPTIEKYTVYSDTVGQYTGTMDKNGVKIFEGDIVEATIHNISGWENIVGLVTYDKDGAGFEVLAADLKLIYGYRRYYHHSFAFLHDLQIIGNIYDNPELLGEEA